MHLAHPWSILLTTTLLFTFVILIYNLSVTQGDGFTEVTHGHMKGKASNSPMLPSPPKSGSSESPLGSPVRPKPSIKNSIPVILSGVDKKFKNWRTLMGELRQFHPNFTDQGTTKSQFCSYRRLSARRYYTTERE